MKINGRKQLTLYMTRMRILDVNKLKIENLYENEIDWYFVLILLAQERLYDPISNRGSTCTHRDQVGVRYLEKN